MDLIERLINKDYLTERERKEWLGTIKERLEVLENENKELNDVIEKYNHLNIQSFFIRDIERDEIKQLKKVIEIIKNKNVDIDLLMSINSLEEYNNNYSIELTQQEYELLKEVINNE